MADYNITGPDGSIVTVKNVPDGVTKEQVESRVYEKNGWADPSVATAEWKTPLTGRGRTGDLTAPEFSGDYLPGMSGLGYELQSMLAFTPESKSALAGKIPGSEVSADRYGTPMISFPGGSRGLFKDAEPGESYYLDKPGVSMRNITDLAGTAAAFSPAGATFNALRGLPLANRAVGSGLMSTGLEGIRQAWLNMLGDPTRQANTIPGVDIPELAMAGGFQALPDYGLGKLTAGTTPPGIPQTIREDITRRAGAAERAEIPLSRGQMSAIPSEVERFRTLQQLPETSPRMAEFLEQQNRASQQATESLIGSMAPPQQRYPMDIARDKAEEVIQGAYRTRSKASRYDEALSDELPPVSTSGARDHLQNIMSEYAQGTPMHNVLNRVNRWLEGDKVPVYDGLGNEIGTEASEQLPIRQLHNVGTELRTMEETARAAGQRTKAMWLNEARGDVLGYIEAVSPEYKEARNVWRELSGPIEELEGGIIGRIRDMDDSQLDAVMKRVFSPVGESSRRARDNVRENLGDAVYNGMKQSYAEQLLSNIQTSGVAETVNWPNMINRALFKTQAMRDMWGEGAQESQRAAIDDLFEALNSAATGRYVGSPTATRQEVMKGLTSRLPESLKRVVTDHVLQAPTSIADRGLAGIAGRQTGRIRERALLEQLGETPEGAYNDLLRRYGPSEGYTLPGTVGSLQTTRRD